MNHYGVMGNPIKHSLSPFIHRLFAEQTAQDMEYSAILVEPEGLAEAITHFQSQGGKGLSITLPFKHRAFSLVDTVSERAQRAQAVNTILFNEEGRFGDNTDGVGLVRDILINQQFSIRQKRVLILGAGGAVRGIIEPILKEEPIDVVIANRTESKAVALANEFSNMGCIQACSLFLLETNGFDLVINATSASLQGEMMDLPCSILKENALCYDMFYGKGMTPFLRWAKEQGAARYVDGLGMLVEQAAESFYVWRNKKPNVQSVLTTLHDLLSHEEEASLVSSSI